MSVERGVKDSLIIWLNVSYFLFSFSSLYSSISLMIETIVRTSFSMSFLIVSFRQVSYVYS